ncbi:hypothetical protein DUNSADRAFT_13383 [Dunaliella salina]|uniref:Encoded protein n=1 Tax=Dunaliella salina TaxID=3046 RepID=A0ABQ7FS51_DUNSA|nr:hypothetical protein DUNSADRAFT_13383 [Dunaliella salina]|eukprot:KAF5825227.1 hypothetical protein DUNSADRAFT_13383 [Dunaliella salina]
MCLPFCATAQVQAQRSATVADNWEEEANVGAVDASVASVRPTLDLREPNMWGALEQVEEDGEVAEEGSRQGAEQAVGNQGKESQKEREEGQSVVARSEDKDIVPEKVEVPDKVEVPSRVDVPDKVEVPGKVEVIDRNGDKVVDNGDVAATRSAQEARGG